MLMPYGLDPTILLLIPAMILSIYSPEQDQKALITSIRERA